MKKRMISCKKVDMVALNLFESFKVQTLIFFSEVLEIIHFQNISSYNYFLNQIFNKDRLMKIIGTRENFLNFKMISLYFANLLEENVNGKKGISSELFLTYLKLIHSNSNFSQKEFANSNEGKSTSLILHDILCEFSLQQPVILRLSISCLFVLPYYLLNVDLLK
jgi:hypothetical protein